MIDFYNNQINLDLFQNILREIKENPNISEDIIDSFSVNQFKAKRKILDLILELPIPSNNLEIVIFGSWYGSLLVPGLAPRAKKITCIDLNEEVLKIGKNKLFFDLNNVDYIQGDVFEKDLSRYHSCDLFINTSCEHMLSMKEWPFWNYAKENAFFAFQSNNMYEIETHINCVSKIKDFKRQLPRNFHITAEDKLQEERGTRFSLVGQIL